MRAYRSLYFCCFRRDFQNATDYVIALGRTEMQIIALCIERRKARAVFARVGAFRLELEGHKMSLRDIEMPEWMLAASKMRGEDCNHIVFLGEHFLARIYARQLVSSGVAFTAIEYKEGIFDAVALLERASLLIVFANDGFEFLRANAVRLRRALAGLPIYQVNDNRSNIYDDEDKSLKIEISTVRIFDDVRSHEIAFEMERLIFERMPNVNITTRPNCQ